MALTCYQILGVNQNAGFAELKRAYYRQAKRCHPDLFRNDPEKTREFQALAGAFDTLSDAEKRRRYDRSLLAAAEWDLHDRPFPAEPIMDSEADDILEELIVGNRTPPESSLATLLADLRKTEVFMAYREGRDHFRHRRFGNAETCFAQAVAAAPRNIVFRVGLARTFAAQKKFGRAIRHYRAAIGLGEKRVPGQRLLRVRRELEEIQRKRFPLFGLFRKLFAGTPAQEGLDDAEIMLGELNRALKREARNLLENRDDQ